MNVGMVDDPGERERLSPHEFAKHLRRHATHAEDALWNELKRSQLGGFKFSFQVPVGPYIADFCCRTHRLIVEVDGITHLGRTERDKERDEALVQLGYVVVRFTDEEVFREKKAVLAKILDALEKRPQFRY